MLSALAFVVVGVVLHFVVQGLVDQQFRSHAEFHAVFVTDAVLIPRLNELEATPVASPAVAGEVATMLQQQAIDLDEAVYHVVIWDPAGASAVFSDAVAYLGPAPAGYAEILEETRRAGTVSVDGVAPYLMASPPVASTIRTFVAFDLDRPLVAEIHQDWTPTLAASRTFSRTLDVGLGAGLIALWMLSLPIAQRAGRQLHQRSRTDELTDLDNRTALEECLDQMLNELAKTDGCVALLFVDVDGFKKINDTYGHAVGDLVLQQVAQRLLGATRTSDRVSRFAGDEFVVILRDTDLVLAEQAARRLVDEIGRPMDDPADLRLSVSVGMATTDDPDIGADNLLRQADAAMYQAKSAGGNRYCVFTEELRERVSRSNEIERELRFAADRDEFHLVFQPFLSLSSDDEAMVAVEALIRWTHPKIGAVGPLEFIPLAERNGAIDEIGAWVLQQVCEYLAAWQALLEPDTPFVVYTNLSPAQLHDGLLDLVDACLASTGADPARLGFEITETAVLEDGDESVVALLCALRDRGCHIALDDFGTGYSSLSRLRATPLDLLKVDGSFVNERTADGREHAILAAVSALAREMEIDVLAEGIETPDQLTFVRALGFDLAQGYGIARPALADQVLNWLPVPSEPMLATSDRRSPG